MAKFHWGVKKTILESPEIKERLGALSEVKFIYDTEPQEGSYSCAKLIVGGKYFIVKTKTIQWLERKLNDVLKQYNMNGTTDMYFPIVKEIHNTGHYDVQVEFLCQSTNPYEVIKQEYKSLQLAKGKRACLNKDFEPYMPKYNAKTKMYGWLTVNQFLNYKKFVAHNPGS